MAIGNTAVWRVRQDTGVSNSNGAGYDAGISGAATDYSQQAAPQATGTHGTAAGTTAFSDTTAAAFTSAMIGNALWISGSGFTTGWYFCTAFTDSSHITIDRSPGTGSAATWNLGGAWADPFTNLGTSGPLVAGNQVYVRGSGSDNPTSADYTAGGNIFPMPAGDGVNGLIRMIGENGRPMLLNNGLLYNTAAGWWFENLYFRSSGTTLGGYGMIRGGDTSFFTTAYNCVFDQNGHDCACLGGPSDINQSVRAILCEFFSSSGGSGGANPAIGISSLNGGIFYCNIHDCVGPGAYLGAIGTMVGCIIAKCSGDGIIADNASANQVYYGCSILNCTIDGNAGNGIKITINYALVTTNIAGNIISNHTGVGKAGINVTFGTLAPNDRMKQFVNFNSFFNNTSHVTGISQGANDNVGIDPQYVAQSTENYAIGTNLKSLGFPQTAFPQHLSGQTTGVQSYMNAGAVQRFCAAVVAAVLTTFQGLLLALWALPPTVFAHFALASESLGGAGPFDASLPAEEMATIKTDGALPDESLAVVRSDEIFTDEFLAVARAEGMLPLEALTSPRADGAVPLELLAFKSVDAAIPDEWLSARASDASLSDEALAGARSDGAMPLEELSARSVDQSLPLEDLRGAQSDAALPDENLATVRSDAQLPDEWVGSVAFIFDGSLPLEFVTSPKSDAALPLEAIANKAFDAIAPDESLRQFTGDAKTPTEFGQGSRLDASLPVEDLASPKSDAVLPDEALGGARSDGTLPNEAQSTARADGSLPGEFLQGARSDSALALEILRTIRYDAALPTESNGTILFIFDNAVPLEFSIARAVDAALSLEFSRRVVFDQAIPAECLLVFSVDNKIPLEDLFGARVDAKTPVEILATSRADAAIPLEVLSTTLAVRQDAGLALEWLATIAKDGILPAEITASIAISGKLPAEFRGFIVPLFSEPLYIARVLRQLRTAIYPVTLRTAAVERQNRVVRFLGASMAAAQDLYPPFTPQEQIPVSFDFAAGLPTGVIVTSVVSISCSVHSGTDATPSARLLGSPQIGTAPPPHGSGVVNGAVLQTVGNCLDGVVYLLQCVAIMSTGAQLSIETHVSCQAPA